VEALGIIGIERKIMKPIRLAGVSVIALSAVAAGLTTASPASAGGSLHQGSEFNKKYTSKGAYMSGDFHNHTTCSDGSTSVQTLTKQSLTYLDWFIQSGHSGSYNRDCRFDDFVEGVPTTLWVDTIGADAIKGDPKPSNDAMWRWQSLQEFQFDLVVEERIAANKPAFVGMEWVVPSHEHTSTSVIAGQYDRKSPNAEAMAHFEYCFAVNSNDTSQGGGQGWTCEIDATDNSKLVDRFTIDPDQGPADYNATLDPATGINTDDNGDHVKSTAAVYWMQEHFPGQSYAVQAHVERQGPFSPGNNRGYNVEHIRDWNNAAPDVSFGFESQPGHQAVRGRGGYGTGASGLGTFGGTGCYAGAEAAKPGYDFDGTPLTDEDLAAWGLTGRDPASVTLCQPGVRTMWDAMLSEGRRFWFFGSSDWHGRGEFGPFETASTGDFWPGEYQKNYTWVRKSNYRKPNPAQDIVDGLRSGNGYVTQGDLIDELEFEACAGGKCATMGETLKVRKGQDVVVTIKLRDPKGANNSPYSFDNPSLLQIGVNQPLNKPELVHVDLITGSVNSIIKPTDADYRNPLAPGTTVMAKMWTSSDWKSFGKDGEWKKMVYVLKNVSGDKYVRIRGSNIPAGTPNEQDENGNPLPDNLSDNIACSDAACPEHINGFLDADVEAWADVWFYANPIFIEVAGRKGHHSDHAWNDHR
jgi:hypothetical protein